MTDRLAIGGNNPPRHEAFAMSLEDVRVEAGNFLDGAPVETQEQADAVGKILGEARRIKSDADKARKEDKKPHSDAAKAVDDDYRPVIQMAQDIIDAANVPLSAWLKAEQDRIEREAQEAAQKAEQARQKALEEERAAAGNIDRIEAARAADKAASAIEAEAKRAAKAKPQVTGATRAIGLKSRQQAKVVDYKALLLHVAKTDKPILDAFLDDYASRSLPAKLPGVEIETVPVAA